MSPQKHQSGYIMLTALVMGMVLSVLAMIAAQVLINNTRFTLYNQRQSRAMDVAEAGVNYYLWHLAHNSTDYKDGGATPASAPYGPYVHNYYDNDGNVLGTFTLTITPPPNGSTITTVRSVGQVTGLPGNRTILAQLGQPSFANYALLTDTEVWFGSSESTNGAVHSNSGVHFDGVNNGPVTSAKQTYTAGNQFGGDGLSHCGVWGNGGPSSQWQPKSNAGNNNAPCSQPVPAVPFASVNMANLASLASSGGVSLAALPNGSYGYYLNLKSDGTIDIYKVTGETSAGFTKTFVRNQSAPGNGVLAASDNLWVDGTNFPGRITIVANRSGVPKSINITNNLTYSAKDGSAAIGLIAQQDVHVARYAPSTLEVDAAALAQNGHVWVDSSTPVKGTITFYGSIATYDYWTWTWVNGSGIVTAGYATTVTNFDTHLIYAPPPQYPTTGTYSILNWREQLYAP